MRWKRQGEICVMVYQFPLCYKSAISFGYRRRRVLEVGVKDSEKAAEIVDMGMDGSRFFKRGVADGDVTHNHI